MKKILVAFLLTFGLYAGSASAITVTLNPANAEILTIGDGVITSPSGLEVDNFSQSQPTVAGGPSIPVDFWVGLDVIVTAVNSTITAEDQSRPGGATTNLNIALYDATAVGNDWTTGALLDTALPSPMLATLSQGLYLLNITGLLPAAINDDLEHNYGVRISSVIPVPAAVWLFGSAILGFLGFRRKASAAAA